jgi:dienelactone hydrolase
MIFPFKSSKNRVKEGIETIKTTNYANKKLSFYYFLSEKALNEKEIAHHFLVCMPGLYTSGQFFVKKPFKKFAEENNLVILAPSFKFDQKYLQQQQSYQFPAVWSGEAFLEIIKKLESKEIKASKLLFFGFSAGAQFSLRFSLWRPDLCLACAAHGSGGQIMPQVYNDVKYFLTVGNMDEARIPNVNMFLENAIKLKMFTTFKLYETGHSLRSEQIEDSFIFYRQVLEHESL